MQPVTRPRSRAVSALLIGIVGVILLSTAAIMAALWPENRTAGGPDDSSAPAGQIVEATVVSLDEVDCFADSEFDPAQFAEPPDPDAELEPDVPAESPDQMSCLEVSAALKIGQQVSFTLDHVQAQSTTIREGDTVRLVENDASLGELGADPVYTFYDHPRGGKLLTIAIVFVLIVIVIGRLRGALSLVGVAASIAILITFMLPSILDGRPPVLVAAAGSIGIMIVVLYLAHGFSHRTTAALFGSIFGILFTAIAGFGVTRWLRFTGIGSTEDSSLLTAVPGLQMNDVLTATMIIAGLGILNDITVSQASAVWELRDISSDASKRRIFRSAMRVGRDHIASSIYTLVFAYAGSMLVVLLLIYSFPRDLIELVTSEQIAQEIVRTLVGAAGLVLAMPVTTFFAVLFARPAVSANGRAPIEAQSSDV